MKLGEYLEKNNIPQIAFCKLIKATQPQISRYVTGKTVPSLKTAIEIARVTNGYVTLQDFISDK